MSNVHFVHTCGVIPLAAVRFSSLDEDFMLPVCHVEIAVGRKAGAPVTPVPPEKPVWPEAPVKPVVAVAPEAPVPPVAPEGPV